MARKPKSIHQRLGKSGPSLREPDGTAWCIAFHPRELWKEGGRVCPVVLRLVRSGNTHLCGTPTFMAQALCKGGRGLPLRLATPARGRATVGKPTRRKGLLEMEDMTCKYMDVGNSLAFWEQRMAWHDRDVSAPPRGRHSGCWSLISSQTRKDFLKLEKSPYY